MTTNLDNFNILWCCWNASGNHENNDIQNDNVRRDVKISNKDNLYQALFEFGIYKQLMELKQFKKDAIQKTGAFFVYGPLANSFKYDVIFCTKHSELGVDIEKLYNIEKGLSPNVVYYQSEDIFYCDSNTFTTMSLIHKFKDFSTKIPLDQMFLSYTINVGLQHVQI
jgi:hypothetical protein